MKNSNILSIRLCNEKCKEIKVGDKIIFINRENTDQKVSAEVTGLLRYDSFADLFSYNDPSKFGGPNKEWLLQQIHEFYTNADESIAGVVGIQFELL